MLTLSETDLDRLEGLLSGDQLGGNAMPLDAMQGFLCAVASAPQPIPVQRWLAAALGDEHDWENDPQAAEAVALVKRFHQEIVLALVEGERVDPILYPVSDESEEHDYAMCALGYLEAVDLCEPAWEAASDADEVEDILFPFLILAGGLEHDAVLRASLELKPQEEQALIENCRDELPDAVQEAFDYWAGKRKPETFRRDGPKIGRNDPCICGSGKKFKQCCGAPHTEH